MAITRLSGGTTPPNGSDPRTFPAIWNDAVDDIEAAEADITTLQNSLNNLEVDDLADVTITNVADGEILAYDTGNWVNQAAPENTGFTKVVAINSSNSNFPVPTDMAHPIARVTVIGAGGGGGGSGRSLHFQYQPGSTGTTGGTTTFNAGGAGTITATGGQGGGGGGRTGGASVNGLTGGNGGQGHSDITVSARGTNGSGGGVSVDYLDMTGITTVNVTIGAGGVGGPRFQSSTPNGIQGGSGQVIFEYVKE